MNCADNHLLYLLKVYQRLHLLYFFFDLTIDISWQAEVLYDRSRGIVWSWDVEKLQGTEDTLALVHFSHDLHAKKANLEGREKVEV